MTAIQSLSQSEHPKKIFKRLKCPRGFLNHNEYVKLSTLIFNKKDLTNRRACVGHFSNLDFVS